MATVRLTAEEKGTKVFDYLTSTDRAGIDLIMVETGLKRPAVNGAVRWLRDTLGEHALICNADHTYELAMTHSAVTDYRNRRQAKMANEAERLYKVIAASLAGLGPDSDQAVASELIRTAITLLRRSDGQRRLFERVG